MRYPARIVHRAQGAKRRRQPAGIRRHHCQCRRCVRSMRPGVLGNRPRAKRRLGLSRPSSFTCTARTLVRSGSDPASLQLVRHVSAQREPCPRSCGYVARCFLLRAPLLQWREPRPWFLQQNIAPQASHRSVNQSCEANGCAQLPIVMTRDKWASSACALRSGWPEQELRASATA